MIKTKNDHIVSEVLKKLGGAKKAKEIIEHEDKIFMDLWNQDTKSIGKVLGIHLFIEYYLNQYLDEKNQNLNKLEKANLTFNQKIKLIPSDDLLIQLLVPGIKEINIIRNKMAHNLNYKVTDSDVKNIKNIKVFWLLEERLSSTKKISYRPIKILEKFGLLCGTWLNPHSSLKNAFAESIINLS